MISEKKRIQIWKKLVPKSLRQYSFCRNSLIKDGREIFFNGEGIWVSIPTEREPGLRTVETGISSNDSFKEISTFDPISVVSIPLSDIKKIVRNCIGKCCTDDYDNLRIELETVLFDFNQIKGLTAVATNGHIMQVEKFKEIECETDKQITISQDIFRLIGILPKAETLHIYLSKDYYYIQYGEVKIYTNSNNSFFKYPNWRKPLAELKEDRVKSFYTKQFKDWIERIKEVYNIKKLSFEDYFVKVLFFKGQVIFYPFKKNEDDPIRCKEVEPLNLKLEKSDQIEKCSMSLIMPRVKDQESKPNKRIKNMDLAYLEEILKPYDSVNFSFGEHDKDAMIVVGIES